MNASHHTTNDTSPDQVDETQSHMQPVVILETLDLNR